jgi:hypothetical protein
MAGCPQGSLITSVQPSSFLPSLLHSYLLHSFEVGFLAWAPEGKKSNPKMLVATNKLLAKLILSRAPSLPCVPPGGKGCAWYCPGLFGHTLLSAPIPEGPPKLPSVPSQMHRCKQPTSAGLGEEPLGGSLLPFHRLF